MKYIIIMTLTAVFGASTDVAVGPIHSSKADCRAATVLVEELGAKIEDVMTVKAECVQFIPSINK